MHAPLYHPDCNAPVCDIGFDEAEHLLGGPSHLDEDTIVDLEETEKLEDLARFGRDLVDTV